MNTMKFLTAPTLLLVVALTPQDDSVAADGSPFISSSSQAESRHFVDVSSPFTFDAPARVEMEGRRTVQQQRDGRIFTFINGVLVGTTPQHTRETETRRSATEQLEGDTLAPAGQPMYLRTMKPILPLGSRELARELLGDDADEIAGVPSARAPRAPSQSRPARRTPPTPPGAPTSNTARTLGSSFDFQVTEDIDDISSLDLQALEQDIEALREQMNME